MPAWTFRPDVYSCPTHYVDLTGEVVAEVLAVPNPIYFDRRGGFKALDFVNLFGTDRAHRPKKGPFVVMVTCPGGGEKGNPHKQLFQGVLS